MAPSDRIHPILAGESEPLKALLRGVEIYAGLTAEDLREMAKFTELPNVMGLPIHPISKPPGGDPVREFQGPLADLPGGMLRHLRAALHEQPMLAVRGYLAGGSRRPFALLGLVPQPYAHLAHGLLNVLWPDTARDASLPADLVMIFLPDFEQQLLMSVPGSKLALIFGTDDIRGGLLVALELANRLWTPAQPEVEDEVNLPESQILPGGSFLADTRSSSPENASPQTLIYSGEGIPIDWEVELPKQIPGLAGRPNLEVTLAGAEPWIAQTDGSVCPLWYNPPLPVQLLKQSSEWAEAALHPAAVPFGLAVDERAHIDFDASDELAYVIVPRRAIPFPFANSAAPVKVRHLWRHSRAREASMRLWAMGFPSAEQIKGL